MLGAGQITQKWGLLDDDAHSNDYENDGRQETLRVAYYDGNVKGWGKDVYYGSYRTDTFWKIRFYTLNVAMPSPDLE